MISDSITTITCKYCGFKGDRSDVHMNGWTLAKSHIGAYVCPVCRPKDEEKKNART